jgi:NTE family protein
MKKICIAILVLMLAYIGLGDCHENRPKIGLVLSGGGARGAAHIGVIEELEALNVPIDMIVGTSMGAVIGGLYASGVPIEKIKHDFSVLDWEEIFSYNIKREYLYYRRKLDTDIFLMKNFLSYSHGEIHLPWGIITGQNLYEIFNSYLLSQEPIYDFSHLSIPFKAVSTDLVTGKPVVLDQGDLALSMLASMAVPGLISPVDMGDYLLVDGGVSANLPIEVAKKMGADIVIVVDVGTPLSTKAQVIDLRGVLGQITNILTYHNVIASKSLLTQRDVLIEPDLKDIETSDFDKFADGIEPGKIAAIEEAQKLQKLSSTSHHDYPHFYTFNYFSLDRVAIKNETFLCPQTYYDYLDFDDGNIDPSLIKEKIDYLYGLSIYERIYYGIENGPGGKQLSVEPKINSDDPLYFQGSLLLDSDFQTVNDFTVIIGITNPQVNSYLGEWRLLGKIGKGNGLFAEYYQPLDASLSWFVNPYASFNRGPVSYYFDYNRLATILDTSSLIGVQFGKTFSNVVRLKGFWEFDYDDFTIKTGSILLPKTFERNGQAGISFEWDAIDNLYFPHHGTKGDVTLSTYDKALGGDNHFSQLAINSLNAISHGKHALALGGKFNRTLNGEPSFNTGFDLGGLFGLSGLSSGELTGSNSALITGIYYYEINQLPIIPNRPTPVYLGASLEGGKVWGETNLSNNEFITSGSIFIGLDSILGPVYIAFGMTDNGRKAAHLAIRPAFK